MLTLSDWLSIAGLVIGVIGFAFTIQQLHRTATAAETSNKLLDSVAERLTTNHLLVMLPQLHLLADELDSAVLGNDDRGAVRALVGYSRTAGQVAALLSASGDEDTQTFIPRLRSSAISAAAAKSIIVSGTNRSLGVVVKTPMAQMAEIAAAASEIITKYQARIS